MEGTRPEGGAEAVYAAGRTLAGTARAAVQSRAGRKANRLKSRQQVRLKALLLPTAVAFMIRPPLR